MESVTKLRPFSRTVAPQPRSLTQLAEDVSVVATAFGASSSAAAMCPSPLTELAALIGSSATAGVPQPGEAPLSEQEFDVLGDRLRCIRQELVARSETDLAAEAAVVGVENKDTSRAQHSTVAHAARMLSLLVICADAAQSLSKPGVGLKDAAAVQRCTARLHEARAMVALIKESGRTDDGRDALVVFAVLVDAVATCFFAAPRFSLEAVLADVFEQHAQRVGAIVNAFASLQPSTEIDVAAVRPLLVAAVSLRRLAVFDASAPAFRPADGIAAIREKLFSLR